MIETIGFIAASLTTCSFVPQAIKIIKTRDTSGISVIMYVMFVAGVFFWMLYGILLNDKALITANLITLVLTSVILCIKIRSFKKLPKLKKQ